MPRVKVLVRKKGNQTAETMLKALKLHRTGVSIRKVAKELQIAYPTLRRYVARNLHVPICNLIDERLTPNYENRSIFTQTQEIELKNYILDCAAKFYGLTVKDCRKVAYQMAKINGIAVPDCWEKDRMAGKEWFRCFKRRHCDLSVKKPEACSLARATAFNRETVKSFFTNLKTAMERHPSFGNGCRIYNLDETATTTVQRPPKVVALKGKHNLSKVTSGEKGTLVTTCAIVCASGQNLPPAMVFPRKNLKDIMLNGAPSGTLGLTHKSGWMTSELFVEVMKHFIKHVNATPENPALLILDNHESHLSIEALNLAKASGVTVLTLHPHTTSKLQPLDVGLNGPFKVFYNNAVDSWMLRHPGSSMTIYSVAECVGEAYARAMTPVNITAAFRKCGIFPYNHDIFTDLDFLPSDVTDRPQPHESDKQQKNAETPANDSDATDCEDIETVPSPTIMDSVPTFDMTQFSDGLINAPVEKRPEQIISAPAILKLGVESEHTIHSPSSPIRRKSEVKVFISPKQFMPPLKAGPRKNMKNNRKRGKSRIATDTPEKDEITDDRQKAKDKKNKIQTVKRAVLKDVPKKKKVKKVILNETSSEEDIEEPPVLSDTEVSDVHDSEDEDMLTVISGNFQKLKRKPVVGDFVFVAFNTNKTKVYYVAEIIEVCGYNTYGASFMRLKNKELMKFKMPLEPDLAEVKLNDIKIILPSPKINGSKNRNTTYIFPIRVAPTISLR